MEEITKQEELEEEGSMETDGATKNTTHSSNSSSSNSNNDHDDGRNNNLFFFTERVTRKGRRLAQNRNRSSSDFSAGQHLHEPQQQHERRHNHPPRSQEPGAVHDTSRPFGINTVQWRLHMARIRRRSEQHRREAQQQQQQQLDSDMTTTTTRQQLPMPRVVEAEIAPPTPTPTSSLSQSIVLGHVMSPEDQEQAAAASATGNNDTERTKRFRTLCTTNVIAFVVVAVILGLSLGLTLGLQPSSKDNNDLAPTNTTTTTTTTTSDDNNNHNNATHHQDNEKTRPYAPTFAPTGWIAPHPWKEVVVLDGLAGDELGTSFSVDPIATANDRMAVGLPGFESGSVRVVHWPTGTTLTTIVGESNSGGFVQIGHTVQLYNQTLAIAGRNEIRFYHPHDDDDNNEYVQIGNAINATHVLPPHLEPSEWSIVDFTFAMDCSYTHVVIVVTVHISGGGNLAVALQAKTTNLFEGLSNSSSPAAANHDNVWSRRGSPATAEQPEWIKRSTLANHGDLWIVGYPFANGVEQIQFRHYQHDLGEWTVHPTRDVLTLPDPSQSLSVVTHHPSQTQEETGGAAAAVSTIQVHHGTALLLQDFVTNTTNGVRSVLQQVELDVNPGGHADSVASMALSGNDGRNVALGWVNRDSTAGITVFEWNRPGGAQTEEGGGGGEDLHSWNVVGTDMFVDLVSTENEETPMRVALSGDGRTVFAAFPKQHLSNLKRNAGSIHIFQLDD